MPKHVTTSKTNRKTNKKFRAMTLIELLVYTAVVGLFLFSLSFLMFSVEELGIKSRATNEVDSNLKVALSKVNYLTRNADEIIELSEDTLVLEQKGEICRIYVEDGTLFIAQGTNILPLTNSKVTANISFMHVGSDGKRPSTRATLTIEYRNPASRSVLDVSQTASTTITLRK